MLFSVLFEQICLDLNIPEGDAYARDAVRRFGMRVFDAGVESAEYALRRERARADHAEAKLRDCERED